MRGNEGFIRRGQESRRPPSTQQIIVVLVRLLVPGTTGTGRQSCRLVCYWYSYWYLVPPEYCRVVPVLIPPSYRHTVTLLVSSVGLVPILVQVVTRSVNTRLYLA